MFACLYSRRHLIAYSLLATVVIIFCLLPDQAFAVEGTIHDHDPGFLEIDDWATKIIYNACSSLATPLLTWASEFYRIIAEGNIIGGELSSFPEVERVVENILNNVLVPVALGFFGLFLGLDLLRIMKDSGNNALRFAGLGVMEEWLIFGIKYGILYVAINHVQLIMYSIFSVFHYISTLVQRNVLVDIDTSGISSTMMDASFQALTYENGPGLAILLLLVAFVVLIVVALTAIYTQVLAIVRIFEIFIGIAFSPIPITMLISRQLSSGGIQFFRWFCGACLQLAVLFAIVGLGGPLITSISGSVTAMFTTTDTAIQGMMTAVVPVISALSLFVMVKSSRTISDKIMGA